MNHGTLTAYTIHACRCEDCSRAASRHGKQYRLRRHQGRVFLVDAQPMRDHVQQLLDAGMSFRAITLAAGWKSRNSLTESLARSTVRVSTYRRVMAVTLDTDTRDTAYVDATGARRRLQSLAVIGWPSRTLAQRLGHRDHSTILDIQTGAKASIRRATSQAISALFDELWDTPGPSAITTGRAVKRDWVPPLAWDDDTIDNPDTAPNLGESDSTTPRGRSRADVVEDYLDTWDHHLGYLPAAATRLGLTEYSLEQALRRSGMPVSRDRQAS